MEAGSVENRILAYNSINIDSKMMINEEKWFLGGIGSNMPQTAREYYETDRSNNVYSDNPKFTLSCIGLVYPSDLYYSVNPLPTTFPNIYSNKSWLFNSAWTITSSSENGSIVYNVVETLEDYAADDADNRYAKYAIPYVYPTLYLKENVKIIGGDGTLENMYQLSL